MMPPLQPVCADGVTTILAIAALVAIVAYAGIVIVELGTQEEDSERYASKEVRAAEAVLHNRGSQEPHTSADLDNITRYRR